MGKLYANSANTLAVPNWTRLDVGARDLFEVLDALTMARLQVDKSATARTGSRPVATMQLITGMQDWRT